MMKTCGECAWIGSPNGLGRGEHTCKLCGAWVHPHETLCVGRRTFEILREEVRRLRNCNKGMRAPTKENAFMARIVELETEIVALRHDLEVAEYELTVSEQRK
jgi:hypothetical protein